MPARAATADAIPWLEEAVADDPRLYATLGDFYDRERRWKDAAGAYAAGGRARAAQPRAEGALRGGAAQRRRPRSSRARRATCSPSAGGAPERRAGAVSAVAGAAAARAISAAAEATARRLIALNSKSPWGYSALAEALEERRQYQAVVDALSPAMSSSDRARTDSSFDARPPAAASRLRVPGARTVRQGDRGVRRSACLSPERRRRSPAT